MSEYIPELLSVDAAITLDVADVVKLEQQIAASGTSLAQLMRQAGSAVALYAAQKAGSGARVLVFAGSGNNGGDGWVAAELLSQQGIHVTLVSKRAPRDISAQPAHDAALHSLAHADKNFFELLIAPCADELSQKLDTAHIVIDAMLGTGFSGTSVCGSTAEWIDLIDTSLKTHSFFVLAVDVPSGLNAQTGAASQPCVHADATITMMAAKPGLLSEAAKAYTGKLYVARIYPIEQLIKNRE